MKKIIVLMMTALFVCSTNSYSLEPVQKSGHKVKSEQTGKKDVKTRLKQKKTKSRKKIQKPKSNKNRKSNRQSRKIVK
jgi:hypothetical protein